LRAEMVANALMAYIRGHETGDCAHMREAFLATAHIERMREGRLKKSAATRNTAQAVTYTVPVAWLKNPSLMPPNVAQQLQALKFTNHDYQTILALDPFANGSTTIDPTRFVPTTYAFPYHAPQQGSECNNGTSSCLAISDTIKK
jgi:hypothetical protein